MRLRLLHSLNVLGVHVEVTRQTQCHTNECESHQIENPPWGSKLAQNGDRVGHHQMLRVSDRK